MNSNMSDSGLEQIHFVAYGLSEYLKVCFQRLAALEAYVQVNAETDSSLLRNEFMQVNYSALFEMLVVVISAFFDPSTTHGNANCSLLELQKVLKADTNGRYVSEKQQIISDIDKIENATLKHLSNKLLAHHDLKETFCPSSDTIKIDDIRQLLLDIQEILSNTFELTVGVRLSDYDYAATLDSFKQTLISFEK